MLMDYIANGFAPSGTLVWLRVCHLKFNVPSTVLYLLHTLHVYMFGGMSIPLLH